MADVPGLEKVLMRTVASNTKAGPSVTQHGLALTLRACETLGDIHLSRMTERTCLCHRLTRIIQHAVWVEPLTFGFGRFNVAVRTERQQALTFVFTKERVRDGGGLT